MNRGDHVKQGQLLAVLENRDLTAAAGESKAQWIRREANLRTTTAATVPEAVVKAQTDVESAREADGRRQEGAGQPAEAVPAGRAGAQAGGRRAGRLRAGAQPASLSAQEHLRRCSPSARRSRSRPPPRRWRRPKRICNRSEAQVGYSQIHSPIAGVVADRPLYAGEMAAPGTPLLTVMDISQGGGARQRSAEPGGHREGRADGDHHADRYRCQESTAR